MRSSTVPVRRGSGRSSLESCIRAVARREIVRDIEKLQEAHPHALRTQRFTRLVIAGLTVVSAVPSAMNTGAPARDMTGSVVGLS